MVWGIVFECGVAALGVVVFNVSGNDRLGGGEVVKAVLPGAFLFEGADKPFTQPVLFRCVRRDVFLFEAVVADQCTVSTRAKDQAVVVTQGEA